MTTTEFESIDMSALNHQHVREIALILFVKCVSGVKVSFTCVHTEMSYSDLVEIWHTVRSMCFMCGKLNTNHLILVEIQLFRPKV